MAKSYGAIPSSGIMTFDKSFARANGQPLDTTSVHYSLSAAKTYAATDVAYVGQVLVVIENSIVSLYQIIDTSGTLKMIMNEENNAWGEF
jgi:hypothetical protein